MNKEETDLIIAEQNKSTEEILKAVAKVKLDYKELCKLKNMRIAELEHQLTHRNCLDCSNHSSKLRMRTLELEKENAELNNFIMQSKKDGISPINALIIKNLANQLTNAKEIIKKFSEFANLEVEYDPEHPQEHTDLWNELCKEAEQFINSEVEK